MDELGVSLAGFAIFWTLGFATALVYVVREYRKWKFPAWIIVVSVLLFPVFPFILPLTAHAARRRLRVLGADPRIVKLKLALAWFAALFAMVGNWLSTEVCNLAVNAEFSEELALSCSFACLFLYLLFLLWTDTRLNGLLFPDRDAAGA